LYNVKYGPVIRATFHVIFTYDTHYTVTYEALIWLGLILFCGRKWK